MTLKRKPTLFEAVSTFLVLAIVVGVGFAIFKIPIQPLLLVAASYAAFIAWRVGLSWSDMESAISSQLKSAMPAILILFSVGIIVGSWIYSGTVPMLIYYGLELINPQFFYVTAFVIVAIVSVATGTAWGSTATAGVALMGVAAELDLSLAIAAGAVISGGVFGDKLSPLSDTTNLAPLVVGVDLYEHIKHMLFTTIPASIIGMIVWLIVGLQTKAGTTTNDESVQALMHQLDTIFNFNLFMLLPFVIILFGAFKKLPTVPIMLLSSIVAVFIGTFSNGFAFVDGMKAMANGFNLEMIPAAIDASIFSDTVVSLLSRGGIFSMTTIVVTIFCGYAFAGIVEASGCLTTILEAIHKRIHSVFQLVLATIIGSVLIVFTAGVASISIIMVGILMKAEYEKRNLAPKNLSRTLEDSGTMILPFVPWGVSGIFYFEVLGVSVADYWMWAIPCYLCIIFALIYAKTGFGISKSESAKLKESTLG